jgi:predicted RNase H-like HicB family nuclease
MALTMRPSGLSSPAYKDEFDVVIYEDGNAVGRIYEVGGIGTPPDVRCFWSMFMLVDWRAGVVTSGKVATLEEAKARLKESLAKACEAGLSSG